MANIQAPVAVPQWFANLPATPVDAATVAAYGASLGNAANPQGSYQISLHWNALIRLPDLAAGSEFHLRQGLNQIHDLLGIVDAAAGVADAAEAANPPANAVNYPYPTTLAVEQARYGGGNLVFPIAMASSNWEDIKKSTYVVSQANNLNNFVSMDDFIQKMTNVYGPEEIITLARFAMRTVKIQWAEVDEEKAFSIWSLAVDSALNGKLGTGKVREFPLLYRDGNGRICIKYHSASIAEMLGSSITGKTFSSIVDAVENELSRNEDMRVLLSSVGFKK